MRSFLIRDILSGSASLPSSVSAAVAISASTPSPSSSSSSPAASSSASSHASLASPNSSHQEDRTTTNTTTDYLHEEEEEQEGEEEEEEQDEEEDGGEGEEEREQREDQNQHHQEQHQQHQHHLHQQQHQHQHQHQHQQQQQPNSPLDALFQMTSSTFDASKRGEKRKERDSDYSGTSSFASKQSAKKKRKSRTAFTNHQIFELERRFSLQKYLSPTDRDDIAMTLNLSNAQVITWFQNRRAKMKRDDEERRRDVETASLLTLQRQFLETFQATTLFAQLRSAMKSDQIKTE